MLIKQSNAFHIFPPLRRIAILKFLHFVWKILSPGLLRTLFTIFLRDLISSRLTAAYRNVTG